MKYNTLSMYYKNIFTLTMHYKYSISDIENMMPFERDIYIDLIDQMIEEQNQQSEF